MQDIESDTGCDTRPRSPDGVLARLSQTAVAQDVYLRAGLDLSRPADTHFTDADCASMVPTALYGCGVGGDGAPLRSVGDVGTVAGVELGLGYAVAPAVRLEALLTYRPRFTFDGHANFLAPDREQSVSVDLSSLSGILAVYVDLPGVGVRPLGPLSPFVGGGLGATRVASGETRMTFPKTRTLVPGTRRTALTWRLTAGVGMSWGERATLAGDRRNQDGAPCAPVTPLCGTADRDDAARIPGSCVVLECR